MGNLFSEPRTESGPETETGTESGPETETGTDPVKPETGTETGTAESSAPETGTAPVKPVPEPGTVTEPGTAPVKPVPVPVPVTGTGTGTATPVKPAPAETSGTIKLKDVTLRPLVLGLPNDLELVINPNAKKSFMKGTFKYKLKNQVDKSEFDKYVHVLKIMAQLARIVYCDLSIIRDVVLGQNFGHDNNKVVNDEITVRDKARSSERTVPADPAKNNGRPMKSYVEPPCDPTPGSNPILTYASSPSDVTFIVLGGDQLRGKNDFFKDTDIVISFKGSSTMKNFKHDLYSQFQASELAELMPAGVKFNPVGKVTAAFVKIMMKSWDILKEEINQKAKPGCRLFITGHSLGGAYASLFAFIVAECHTTHFKNIGSAHLVTFGAPTLLSDTARNNFNRHLNAGFLTLDRVTSQTKALIHDPIPSIPVGFSQPGYQPLKTELLPETGKGRAYQLPNLEKLFVRPPSGGGRRKTQRGGAFWEGPEKQKYKNETGTHMPTLVLIGAITLKGQTFAHAEYFDMTYFGAFRLPGMKNPGYLVKETKTRYTFVGRVYEDGIAYEYKESKSNIIDASDAIPDPDPTDKTDMAYAGEGAPKGEVEEAIPDEVKVPEAIPDEVKVPEAIPEKAIPKVPEAIPEVNKPEVKVTIPDEVNKPEVNKPEVNKPAYDYDTYGPNRDDYPAGEEGYAEFEEAQKAFQEQKKLNRANKAKKATMSTLPKMQSGPGVVNKEIITNQPPSISVVGGSRRTSQRRRTARKINKRKNKNKSIRKQKK